MTLLQIGILGIILLLVLIFLRFPISMSLIVTGVVGYALIINPKAALIKLGTDVFDNTTIYSLSVIPMFMLMGMFLGASGLGSQLFNAFHCWFGHIRGGLAIAAIVACTFFSAVSGSVIGTAVTIGKIAAPEMRARNYKESLIAGSVAAGGTLGILLPPSSILIIYGALTEESIGQLFIAGIVPGIMTAVMLSFTAWLQVRLKPDLAPTGPKAPMKARLESSKAIWPVLVIFLFCMSGIYLGLFTPNEGGAAGAFLAFVYSVLSRQMTWNGFNTALQDTAKTTVMTFMVIIGGMIFGNFLTVTRIPLLIRDLVIDLNLSPFFMALLIYACYISIGLFMDAMAIIVIFTNIFYPLIITAGFSGVWFGIMTIFMVNIGFITPPVGALSMVTASATGIKLESVFKGVTPFWITLIAAAILLTIFPQIVTFLPGLMRGV